jgi:hypothetical protein
MCEGPAEAVLVTGPFGGNHERHEKHEKMGDLFVVQLRGLVFGTTDDTEDTDGVGWRFVGDL